MVAVASERGAVLDLTDHLQPAVAVIEARALRLDGLALTWLLRRHRPATQVVVVSVYATLHDPALAAEACRFLLKDCSRAELVAAIVLAAQGDCETSGNSPEERGGIRNLVEEPADVG